VNKNKWQIWKEKNIGDQARPWDMINPKIQKLSEEESKKRLDICLSCDRLFTKTSQCKECGCYMPAKTKLPHASCPLGKW
jgi:peptide deformylase